MLGAFGLNEAMVRWLDDLSVQGIFTTDANLIVQGWNAWLEAQSGLSRDSVVGLHLLDIFPELESRGLHEFYKEAVQGHVQVLSHRFHRYLLRFPSPPGLPFAEMQQSVRIAPLFRDGAIIGTVTVIDDVTERVVRESELKVARDEAERANRAKDDFLATLAHELRTPINNVLGWIYILRMRSTDETLLERALNSIEQNTLLQVELVEELIDISRIVAGKLQIESIDVDLGAMLKSVLETSRLAAERKGLALKAQIPSDVVLIVGDAKRVQQIISNLLNNAIKFTPSGGQVLVELETSHTDCEIRVTDTGIGIKPEFLPHIFERFQQAQSIERQHGLGLGLDIVKRLVSLHGGAVFAHSDGEGRGATFKVRLPLKILSRNNATAT